MLTFLIGFMGAGKSTLGSTLASRLGCRFIDIDTEVERQTQRTISELFACIGEPEFRKVEQQILFNTVKQLHEAKCDNHRTDTHPHGTVIACGGGAPCYQNNLAFMKTNGFVIYLEVTPETLCERLLRTPAEARPLLPHRDPATLLHHIHTLLAERKPYYEAARWKC